MDAGAGAHDAGNKLPSYHRADRPVWDEQAAKWASMNRLVGNPAPQPWI
jgi:hypothetical protein